ncbi:PDDEXK nuclease domain-containing protein [Pedobacter alpinus]|uniref:YhcG family protein n=1 Tax=Pedobacter alpinus TaxID=1590643 RepID=A0ABW5TQ58_9SPHI
MEPQNQSGYLEFEPILHLIQEAKRRVYAKINAELVLLYFNVGKIVSEKIESANWGEDTVNQLAKFILSYYPELSGFNRRGLYRMRQFYETYGVNSECFLLWVSISNSKVSPAATLLENSDFKEDIKVSPTATQLEKHDLFLKNLLLKISWTNHLEIFSSNKKAEEILFYTLMSEKESWSKEQLRRQIKTATFERTMLSKQQNLKNTNSIAQITNNLFKDPYIFEFLNLPENHNEKDFEKAIIQNLQKFILEVGKGFTYMGNQYRLQIGNKDYYTDLLFYHRDLECLILFELKIEDFAPEFLGKLNFYLEALDRDVRRPHEKPSIGILLCKGKDTEVVEYSLARNMSPAIIADYETKLIDKKVLVEKINQLTELFESKI